MQVKIYHPELGPGKTRLSADVAASATSSTVENYDGFATNDYIVFGKLAEEKSEIVKLTSVTANVTLGHTTGPVFAHSARTLVSQIKYNQVKVYSSSSETGTYALLTTASLDVDQTQTFYDDTTGDSDTWYKVKYYNSTTTTLSSYSDAVQGTGYTEDSLRSMVDEVLGDFGDPDAKEITRYKVRRYLRAGARQLTTKLIKTFPEYRKKYTTQSLTSGTATYDLPSRFLAFIRVDINLTGTSTTEAHKANYETEFEGDSDTIYYTNEPKIFFRSSATTEQFGIRPTPAATGIAILWYWDYPATMTDDADEHGLTYGARDLLVTYALVRSWRTKDSAKSDEYKADLTEETKSFLEFISGTKQFMDNKGVETTFAEDLFEFVG